MTYPFDDDVWELYHVAEDFSGARDLANEHPEKLAELQQLFEEQAEKYNVYPLYDDMIARIGKQQDRHANRGKGIAAHQGSLTHHRNRARRHG
jgi:arylsulfatase